MGKVSVDLESPSPYIESDSFFHRLKRNLSYSFAIRRIRKRFARQEEFSILEVGTGSGFFFSAARREFPRATLSGVEYDPRLLETTKKRAPFAHCIQANAETFDLQPQKFDVVVSFQVIEHLYDPSAMLARVGSHLQPGGLFARNEQVAAGPVELVAAGGVWSRPVAAWGIVRRCVQGQ